MLWGERGFMTRQFCDVCNVELLLFAAFCGVSLEKCISHVDKLALRSLVSNN